MDERAGATVPRMSGRGPLIDDEIAALRAATPGCDGELIHLNHAGASLPTRTVLDANIAHLRAEAVEGGYEAAAAAADRRRAVYTSIARMLGADASEIARTEHATSAWNAAFWSVPMEAGQRIVVHDHEYGANIVAFLHAVRQRGIVVDRVGNDGTGQVDVEAVEAKLAGGDVALVSLTHVPTNGGLVNPARDVGRLTRAAGVPFLLDACQSVGQLQLDVDDIGCDLLSATGRKYLRGPRGTGFLYVRSSMLDRLTPSQPDHHGTALVAEDRFTWAPGAQRFEHWEHDVAGWLALGVAVDEALALGLDRIEATIGPRADRLRTMLADAGFVVHDLGSTRCGIVTTSHPDVDAESLRAALRAARINTTTTLADSSRWDADRRALPTMVRLSVHVTTTDAELDRAVDVLRHAVRRIR
jgi:selenocysteine lyase/cysteine desulfurase